MTGEKERVDAYINTINRLEPDIVMIDHDAGIASIAISLKRIANYLEALPDKVGESIYNAITQAELASRGHR